MRVTNLLSRSYFLLTASLLVCTSFATAFLETTAVQADDNQPAKVDNSASPAATDPLVPTGSAGVPPASDPASSSTAPSEVDPEHKAHSVARTMLAPKPGQKIKINGYSEKQPAVVVDDAGSSNDQPSLHRAHMKLTGSMCYSCLKEMQDKLKIVFGVERTKLEKAEEISVLSSAPALGNYAIAIVYYDAKRVDLVDLRAYMRTNGYFSYKVVDKEVDSVPLESHKKF